MIKFKNAYENGLGVTSLAQRIKSVYAIRLPVSWKYQYKSQERFAVTVTVPRPQYITRATETRKKGEKGNYA